MITRQIDRLLGKVELTIFAIQTEMDFFEDMSEEQRLEALERLKAINLLMEEVLLLQYVSAPNNETQVA